MVGPLPHLPLELLALQDLQSRQFTGESIERHQEFGGRRSSRPAAELPRSVRLQNEDAAGAQAADGRGVEGDTDRRREVAEDGDDPGPFPRLDRKAAQVGLPRLNANPPFLRQLACLGQTGLGLVDRDDLVSQTRQKDGVPPLALPEHQDGAGGNTIRDRREEIVRLRTERKPRLGVAFIPLMWLHSFLSFRTSFSAEGLYHPLLGVKADCFSPGTSFGDFMKKLLSTALLLALAGCQASSQPSTPADSPPEPQIQTYREVDGQALKAFVFAPAGHRGERTSAILLFHGGGWSTGSADWTFNAARRFAGFGMVAIPIDYRLSEGNVTPIEALSDVCAAFRWARQHADDLGIDPRRVAGYGVSAGGHLLASTVTVGCPSEDGNEFRSEPDALLLWSPALDLSRDGWFEKKLQGRATSLQYSPVEHIRPSTPPTSIVIGAEDTLTPLSGAKRYCDQLIQAGGICELNVQEGVGHLLTRNLKNQEDDYDPDPEAVAAGIAQHKRFLMERGFISGY